MLPQTYRKLADLRLRNTPSSFAEFAVKELSVNFAVPSSVDYISQNNDVKCFLLKPNCSLAIALQSKKMYSVFCELFFENFSKRIYDGNRAIMYSFIFSSFVNWCYFCIFLMSKKMCAL